MRQVACVLFTLGSAALSAATLSTVSLAPSVTSCAALLAGLWIVLLVRRAGARSLTSTLVLFVALSVTVALVGGVPHLVAAAVALALFGWDTALTAQTVDPFPPLDRRRLVRRQLLKVLFLGGSGFALAACALEWRVRLGFSATLGLGLASLVVLGVGFRALIRRPGK